MEDRLAGEGLTFDDVLLLPGKSSILPKEVDTATRLTRNVRLKMPVVSAAMDTVTEARMAIAIAQEGGIGVLHKNMPAERHAAEVRVVKRAASIVITDPVTLPPSTTLGEARVVMAANDITGIPIVEGDRLVGILTGRDIRRALDAGADAVLVGTAVLQAEDPAARLIELIDEAETLQTR